MKRSEAEKLLGGYATGTLTEAERSRLFAAALEQQAIFEALLDEEALRELLADPAAKAQLLTALAAPATPRIVPFWRRTGVLGAAASLIVAATAGLAYLRSPNTMQSMARSEPAKEPAAKAVGAPATKAAEAPATLAAAASAAKAPDASAAGKAPSELRRKAAPAAPTRDADQPRQEAMAPVAPVVSAHAAALAPQSVAASATGAVVPVAEDSARLKEKPDFRRAEARDQLYKKAEARPAAAAVMDVVSANRGDAPERKAVTQDKVAGGVPGVSGGVVGGEVGGVVASSSSPTAAKAKAVGDLAMNAAASPAMPTWALETQPDGRTRVTVTAPRGRPVTLLRRGSAGVEVLPLQASDDRGKALIQWRAELRLAAGDALDLYLLNAPVAEPAKLPETGPVDGFRVRIYPASKN
jgi:hypothetical protein